MTEEEDKDGGYDCDLIEEPPDDLICPICLLPPRKPHLISCCGTKLCHSCVDRVKQAGQPCPCCREEEYIIVIDRKVERQVLDLKVYCRNKSKGCPWSGELRDLEKHTESCHATSAELLAKKNEIIKKQAEDIKRLEEENKELVGMNNKMKNLLQTKREEETAMKRSIEALNMENEQLKRQLKDVKQSPSPSPPNSLQYELPGEQHEVGIEHQVEELKKLKEQNRKLNDELLEGSSYQETTSIDSIMNYEQFKLLKPSVPKYIPSTILPLYGPDSIEPSVSKYTPSTSLPNPLYSPVKPSVSKYISSTGLSPYGPDSIKPSVSKYTPSTSLPNPLYSPDSIKPSVSKYTPSTSLSPYGPGYRPNSGTVHPPAPQRPQQHGGYAAPTPHRPQPQQFDRDGANGTRQCPMCHLSFPTRTTQHVFEQHVSSHFGN